MLKFKKEYSRAWNFLKESKNYIYIITGIFALFALIGFIFPVFFVDEIIEMIKEIFAQTENLSGVGLIFFIIQNNLWVSVMGILGGFILGIVPVVSIILNGYVLGFVMRFAVEESGSWVLLKLLPHGIFEIPAVLISLGIGLKIGRDLFRKKDVGKKAKFNLLNALRVFVLVVIPLLIVAGIIEGVLIGLAR